MHYHNLVSLLKISHPKQLSIAGLSIFLSMPLMASERVVLQHKSFNDLQNMSQVLLPDKPETFTQKNINSLQFLSQHTDKKQTTHIRMQQQYAGFPVFGGYAILHRYAQTIVSMNGVVYRGLEAELGNVPDDYLKLAPLVLKKFIDQFNNQPMQEQQISPIVYIDESHRSHWAYKVSVWLQPQDTMPSRPSAIIDANTGVILQSWDDVKTLLKSSKQDTSLTFVKGLGFGGNPRIGKYQFGKNFPSLELLRNDALSLCYMENKHVKVVDMDYGYDKSQSTMAFSCALVSDDNAYWTGYNADGYDRQNGSYSPSNDALYIGGLIKQMYSQEYGVEALIAHNKPMKLVMRVHYGKLYSNAFWDGRQMTFGDGDDMTYSLVSLGIGAHEVSHGFTEQHSSLAYFGQSGGINESFSDMAAQAAEFYMNGKSSWLIGAEVLKAKKGYAAFRFMDKPSRDGISIDRADQFQVGMDVHHSSGVYNHLFYLLANQAGWDPHKAFQVMLKANMDYWTPNSTFDEGACGIIEAAKDLNYSVDDVERSLDDVMIDYYDC